MRKKAEGRPILEIIWGGSKEGGGEVRKWRDTMILFTKISTQRNA